MFTKISRNFGLNGTGTTGTTLIDIYVTVMDNFEFLEENQN